MMKAFTPAVAAVALFFMTPASAQDNSIPLIRDEVAAIKKKLVAAFDALGQPPAGYATERESFNLPTETYKNKPSGLFSPFSASADRQYKTNVGSEKANENMQKDYQKKMLEAQAKGDYQEMSRLAQEMQQKASAAQLKAVEGTKEPIGVNLHCNSNPYATIDPDAVMFEKAGVIALKHASDNNSKTVRISVYFDPVALKSTKELSRVDMKMPEGGVAQKTALLNMTVEISGPPAEVESWVKRIDTGKVLAQISGR